MKKLKTKKELDDIIHSMNSDSLCVVKIGASWCSPCKQLERVIHNVETSNDQYLFYDIDIDDCDTEIIDTFNIMSVPITLFYKGGLLVDKVLGSITEPMFNNLLITNNNK